MNTSKSNISELTEEQIIFLEAELINYEKNPKEGSTWEEVKKRILSTS